MRVVVVGAGVAGLESALALQALATGLVSPVEKWWRPSSISRIALSPWRKHFISARCAASPLERLVRLAGAQLRRGWSPSLDADLKILTLEDGAAPEYDALVLALGARPRAAVPGALTFRGAEDRSR